MKMIKHIQTWLLITLLALSANGVANAKLASGHQNLSGNLQQSQTLLNALLHQGLEEASTTDTSGSPLATKGARRGLPAPNQSVINDIRSLPSNATLSRGQIDELSKNIDLVLQNNLPRALAGGNKNKVNAILEVLKGNEKVLKGKNGAGPRLPRFRPEFVRQIPGAQEKISRGLADLGL